MEAASPSFDILVAGEINPDLIFSDPNLEVRFGQAETLVQELTLTIGSSAAIFSCGAARLGLRTALCGVVGTDLFGRFMLEALEQRQVSTSAAIIDPAIQTGLSAILNRAGDRAIVTFPGAISALRAEQVSDAILRQARHLHVTSYFLQTALQPGLPDLFRRAHALGLTTSLDTNWDPQEGWSGVLDLLASVDVFLPNENEARALTGQSDVEVAARLLAEKTPLVAVKLGADGALAVRGVQTAAPNAEGAQPSSQLELVRAHGLPLKSIVDAVGAGDSFDAGFLYGYLHGWELFACLRLGNACGALSTQSAGGVNGQPSLAQALAALEHI